MKQNDLMQEKTIYILLYRVITLQVADSSRCDEITMVEDRADFKCLEDRGNQSRARERLSEEGRY